MVKWHEQDELPETCPEGSAEGRSKELPINIAKYGDRDHRVYVGGFMIKITCGTKWISHAETGCVEINLENIIRWAYMAEVLEVIDNAKIH